MAAERLGPKEPGREVLEDMLKRLDDTERAVNQIPTPLAYAENLYFFREHVDVVRRRIARRLSNESASSDPAAAPMRASEGGR
jgi:hypothetical protein